MEPFITVSFENPNDDDEIVETPKARLFILFDEEVWVPRAVIESVDNEEQTVDIHTWWAEKNGLV